MKIDVDVKSLKSSAGNITFCAARIRSAADKVEHAINGLDLSNQSYAAAAKKLRINKQAIVKIADNIKKISGKTEQIADLYLKTDKKIGAAKSNITKKDWWDSKDILKNSVIAGIGATIGTTAASGTRYKGEIYNSADSQYRKYGGYQGSPEKHPEDFYSLIHKYYPYMPKCFMNKLLKKLKDEGCGYVAVINTLFAQYVGREDEFKKTFGFSMYDENGYFNYDKLLVDFYCAYDNKNELFGVSYKDFTEDHFSATDGTGVSLESLEYRWESYCKDHGINVDVVDKSVTIDNYQSVSEKGEVLVGTIPVIITDMSGEFYYIDGGHFMTVTGVTEDGRFIVSSWGKQFYLDPGDPFESVDFRQVRYK